MRNLIYTLLLAAAVLVLNPRPAGAAEPGWSPVIIATGQYRKQIQSTPIEYRPYRPLHFYGNTIRRVHHRGTPLPVPKEMAPARLVDRSLSLLRPSSLLRP